MNCCNYTAIVEESPAPLTFYALGNAVSGSETFAGMKKVDWNSVKVCSKADFISLFENPGEPADVTEKEFTPPNRAMHGKVFLAAQKIDGKPVYGSSIKVQTFSNGLVRSVDYNFSSAAYNMKFTGKPFPSALADSLIKDVKNGKLTTPEEMIYDPALTGAKGEVQLVWSVELHINQTPSARYFISQKDGKFLKKIPFLQKNR